MTSNQQRASTSNDIKMMMKPERIRMGASTKPRGGAYWFFCLALCSIVGSVYGAIDQAGFGYQASTDVSQILNLALDIRDMRLSDKDTSRDIYENGKNGGSLTLQSLSYTAENNYSNFSIFNVYKHAFMVVGKELEADGDGNFDGAPPSRYADTLVSDLFDLQLKRIEADGTLILNVMMACWGELFELLGACKRNDGSTQVDMQAALDKAAALWVGAGQEKDDNQSGNMMYNMAEFAGAKFLQDSGESEMNTLILKSLSFLKSAITSNKCASGGYGNVRTLVQQIVSYSNVVLTQMLLHHVYNVENEGGSDYVELFALSLLPQIAACDHGLYETLLDTTIMVDLTKNETKGVIATLQKSYSCLGITCANVGAYKGNLIPQCADEDSSGFPSLASYNPRTNVRQTSYVDRDITQISIMMQFEANDAAIDLYQYGWNSPLTLQQLATNKFGLDSSSASVFDVYNAYYGSTDSSFADSMITKVMQRESPFDSATAEQRSATVVGTLQSNVMYLATVSSLSAAVGACSSKNGNDKELWDSGVAFFVGSTEGEELGGQPGGESIYGLAKQFCDDFGTCEPGGAAVDEIILQSMIVGSNALNSGSCQQAQSVLKNQILPRLTIPLIQGLLMFATQSAENATSASAGSLYAFSRVLLPTFDATNSEGAATVKVATNFDGSPVSTGVSALADAVELVVASMDTPCNEIGTLTSASGQQYNVCGYVVATQAYSPTTNITQTALLLRDVQAMRNAGNDDAKKKSIYRNGQNAKPLSLAALSLNANKTGMSSVLYNIYRYSFKELGRTRENDTLGQFDGFTVDGYANTLVEDLFALSIPDIEADGALILNVVMAFWTSLDQMLASCKQNTEDMSYYLDTAAAYYFGDRILSGVGFKAFALYDLAEQAGLSFSQSEGESRANRLVSETFALLQSDIAKSECTSGVTGYEIVLKKTKTLIRLTNVVLMQMLIYHVQNITGEGKNDLTELYTLSLLPQITACDSNLHAKFLNLTVDNYVTDATKQDTLDMLQASYHCLGITCADIGGYEGNTACDDGLSAELPALAGYSPLTDVRGKSYADLDVKYVNILMGMNAYDAALDVYTNGWNTDFSLQQLALNRYSNGSNDTFTLFHSYSLSSEEPSIDTTILNILSKTSPYDSATDEQRVSMVQSALQGTVMYLAMSGQFESAAASCSAGGILSSTLEMWDSGVAFFVGSAEGTSAGGQAGGESLYGLAKSTCGEFGTCTTTNALINDSIMNFITFGRNALTTGDCDTATKLLKGEIQPRLLVPLIQSTLLYTALTVANDTSSSLGKMYSFSRAVLPAVNNVDAMSADVIDRNTRFDEKTTIVPDGAESVFKAFHDALLHMTTKCEDIGVLTTGDIQSSLKRGVCDDNSPNLSSAPVTASPSTQPVSGPTTDSPIYVPPPTSEGLAWGRYIFVNKTAAETDSKLALDVKDMYYSSSPADAEIVYRHGSNILEGLSGGLNISTLSSLSTNASTFMSDDPMFNFFRLALYEDASFDESNWTSNQWAFGDAVVQLALNPKNGNSSRLGSEAVVVMNSWMFLTNRLYEAVRLCRDQSADAVRLIDSSVGLWIGQEQAEGLFDSGWMIYSVAQEAAKLYGNAEAEAKVNSDLMTAFNDAQKVAKTCLDNQKSFISLRIQVNEVIRLLSVPLLQHLLYYMSQNSLNYVELYALAFIPQAISCNVGSYDILRDNLFEGLKNNLTEENDFLVDFTGILSCLRMTCKDLGDTAQSNQSLKNLVEKICTKLSVDYNPKFLASYEASTDIAELARVDLDINNIRLFMQARAYDLAMDIYVNGQNSLNSQGGLLSLQELALDSGRSSAGDFFDKYRTYFRSDTYADDIILEAIGREDGLFIGASRAQLAEVVFRSMQTLVSSMQVVAKLRSSVSQCRSDTSNSTRSLVVKEIDEAVALFVGSIEGPKSGGSDTNSGMMMMGLAKETCDAFNTCETNGDAASNQFLLFAFSSVKQWLMEGNCDSAEDIIEQNIMSMLPVSLIQGSVQYASINAPLPAGVANKTLATGAILADAVLPLVYAVNKTSAATILKNMDFNPDQNSVIDGAAVVADAFATAVRGMGVDCKSVGTLILDNFSVCDLNVAPLPDSPTNLGGNLYVTTTYVQDQANIALDIKQIQDSLQIGEQDLAEIIYKKGENSAIYDENGVKVGLRSLASFSANASMTMVENALYQVAVYALRDSKGMYLGADAARYADTIVMKSFAVGGKTSLATEAAVALNLWMELANELFEMVTRCRERSIVDSDGVQSIDEAAAYWIGDGQLTGDGNRGHLLYALAERMADNFRVVDSSGQASVNINILSLLNQAKIELAYPGACVTSLITVTRLRHIVDKIIAQMTVVNIQGLIHNLYMADRDRVRIYAHAVIPLTAACSPTTFSYLSDQLLNVTYKETEVDTIVQTIRSTYPCFGITCDDIGVHKTEEVGECQDTSARTAMAGYKPASDVREYAQLDLDILELDILLQMGAYAAAEDLYMYGKHSWTGLDNDRASLSLGYLATATGRQNVPESAIMSSYYDGNNNYADTMVHDALYVKSTVPESRRRYLVVNTCRYMIMPMAASESLYTAASTCDDSGATPDALESWEQAAALTIGSLEGSNSGGSHEGQLTWALAKQECGDYGTCSHIVSNSAKVNDRLSSLLYAGRAAVQGGNCAAVHKTINEIKSLLLVPIIQATLDSFVTLVELRSSRNVKQKEEVWTQAYVYAHALLPLINEVNKDAATLIADNVDFAKGKPVPAGIIPVINAYTKVLSGLKVDCQDVGESSDVDACSGNVYSKKGKVGIIVGVLIGCITVVGLFMMLRAHRKRRKGGNGISFVRCEKGEMNHVADRFESSISRLEGDRSSSQQSCETENLHEFLNNNNDRASTPTSSSEGDDDEDEDYEDDAFMESILEQLPDDGEKMQVV